MKSMLIASKRPRNKPTEDEKLLIIKLKNSTLEQVSTFKLLGITVDHELSFDDHVDSLCGKLAQRIGILRSIRSLLPQNERVLLYNTTIKPILMYSSSIWGSITSKQNLTSLLKLQKRAARVILNKNTRESRTVVLLKSLNWLPFVQQIKVNQCSLLMKRLQGQVLEYLETKRTRISDVSTRATRHSRKAFYCPWYNQETEGGLLNFGTRYQIK